ncbi:MAG: general stress protein [Cyanobacteria bacterium]|nr:general stress protein [Cyanobacteriota bacterium]
MKPKAIAIAIFNSHIDAEDAIKELQKDGFDMKKLSILGKDYHTNEHVIGYVNTGDRVLAWGKLGAFWGGIFGAFLGSGLFFIPVVGSVFIAGPILAVMVGALEGAAIVGGLNALGAALVSLGIPEDTVIRYETEIKADKFMLIVHGTAAEALKAKELVRQFEEVIELDRVPA